jgi:hypothetical protein
MSTYAIALIQLPIEIKEDMTVAHLTDRIEVHCVECSEDKLPSKKPELYVSTKMNQYVQQIIESKQNQNQNPDSPPDTNAYVEPSEEQNNILDHTIDEIVNEVQTPIIETKINTIPILETYPSRKERSVTTFKNYKTKHVKNRTLRNVFA